MSLGDIFSGIVDAGKAAYNFVQGNSVASTLLKTVLTGYAMNKTSAAIKKENNAATSSERTGSITTIDPGVRLQIPPNQNEKVPVVYGNAQLSGIITEAVMDQNNTRMTYVLTICEMTGTKLSDSAASTFTFNDIYWNDQRIVFDTAGANAGIVADYSVDRDGTFDVSIDGLVKIVCYNGDSESPVAPQGYTNGSLPNAYDLVPNWTSDWMMTDLVFAVVQVTYSKEKGVTGLPTVRFDISNSMTLPGDCLLDYMTSTRYGASIEATEIFQQ